MRLKYECRLRLIFLPMLTGIIAFACSPLLLGQQVNRSGRSGSLLVERSAPETDQPAVQIAAKPVAFPVEIDGTLQSLLENGPQDGVTQNTNSGSVDQNTPESVAGKPTTGLTVESLEFIATKSNPSILRASAQIAAAKGRAYQAGLRSNPEVGFDFQQLGSSGRAEQYGVLVQQEVVRSE